MIQYQYKCVCGRQLSTWVSQQSLKAGEQCDSCCRTYDVLYDGTVKPMPLPQGATVTLLGAIHRNKVEINTDWNKDEWKSSITATAVPRNEAPDR